MCLCTSLCIFRLRTMVMIRKYEIRSKKHKHTHSEKSVSCTWKPEFKLLVCMWRSYYIIDCFAFVFRILTLFRCFTKYHFLQMHSSQFANKHSPTYFFKPQFQDMHTKSVKCSAFKCQICVCRSQCICGSLFIFVYRSFWHWFTLENVNMIHKCSQPVRGVAYMWCHVPSISLL